MHVDIETVSPLCSGQTICDARPNSTLPKNVRVARHINVPRFWELVLAAVARADAVAPMNSGAGQ
jgi:inosine-uridine nucleoside N-ribohydrolase